MSEGNVISFGANTPIPDADKAYNKHGDELVLPDEVLEDMKDQLDCVMVIGWTPDGSLKFTCSNNFPNTEKLWMLEHAKIALLQDP